MTFTPPDGVAFWTPEPVAPERLATFLRSVLPFLRSLQPQDRPLRGYHDWWEHDGLHFDKGGLDWDRAAEKLGSASSLRAATPDDDAVHFGIAPVPSSWYLRVRVAVESDDSEPEGSLGLVLSAEDAATFKSRFSLLEPILLNECTASDYYKRVLSP